MLQLQINQTWAQIGIKSTPGTLQVQNPGYTLDMSVTQPQIRVEATLPQITIDQSQCFAEAGRKGLTAFSADMVSYAKSAMLGSIARIAEQGNEMAALPNAVNVIAEQGYSNAYDQFEKEFGMVTIPTSRPKIGLKEGTVDIQVTPGEVVNNTTLQKTSLQYTKGAVEVYLKQRPSIDVRFVDVKG